MSKTGIGEEIHIHCIGLLVLLGVQVAARMLRVAPWMAKALGWVSYLAAMAVPIVHGALMVYTSHRLDKEVRGDDADGMWGAVTRNAGVIVWMLPMLGVLGDIRRMESVLGGEVSVGGQKMVVGGSGVLAMMAAIALCGQRVLGGDAHVCGAEVCVVVAGDVAVLSMYCVRLVAPGIARKHSVVPLAYMAFGAAVCVMAVVLWLCAMGAGKSARMHSLATWGTGASSGRLRIIGVAASVVSMVLVVAGVADPEWHSMEYRGGVRSKGMGDAARSVRVN